MRQLRVRQFYFFVVVVALLPNPGYPVVNDPLYNHSVFGPEKGKGGRIGKTDERLIQDLICIHNAENWLGGGLEGAEEGTGGPTGMLIQTREW